MQWDYKYVILYCLIGAGVTGSMMEKKSAFFSPRKLNSKALARTRARAQTSHAVKLLSAEAHQISISGRDKEPEDSYLTLT